MSRRSDQERVLAQWEREVLRAQREGREPPPRPDLEAPSAPPVPGGQPWPAAEEQVVIGSGGPAHGGPGAERDQRALERAREQGAELPPAWQPPIAQAPSAAQPQPTTIRRGRPGRGRGRSGGDGAPGDAPGPMRTLLPELATPDPHGRRGVTVGRVAAVVALLLILAAAWFLNQLFQPFHGAAGAPVLVRVPEGESARQIGDLLQRRGVVSSSFFFSLRATLSGDRSKLGAGTFHMRRDMSYAVALKALTKAPAPPKTLTLTLPEGLWARELAARAKTAGVRGSYQLAARGRPGFDPGVYGARSPRTLEGFLFPATYTLRVPVSAANLVDEQLTSFRRQFARVDLSHARANHLSAYDVLIIASMVEGEAATKADRPKVAAVIYNRLRAHMPLALDATLRYALHDRAHALTQSQLALASPFNTRTNKGLPPSPIGNPGLAAMQAAAHPAAAPYLYFVVRPGACGMVFTDSYATFLRDQARYTAALQKLGHSPSTCQR